MRVNECEKRPKQPASPLAEIKKAVHGSFRNGSFCMDCNTIYIQVYLAQFQGFNCLKKSLPLSSTKMYAWKSST